MAIPIPCKRGSQVKRFKRVFFTLAILCGLAISAVSITGCTANQRAKKFGGTVEYKLPPGKKLVTATWKDDSIWYLMRDMKPGEEPETHEFVQESSFGVFEGKVVFKEFKK